MTSEAGPKSTRLTVQSGYHSGAGLPIDVNKNRLGKRIYKKFRLPGDFHCELWHGGRFGTGRGPFSTPNWTMLSNYHDSFLSHHLLDVILCIKGTKKKIDLLPTFEPECLGLLKKTQHILYHLQGVVYFL